MTNTTQICGAVILHSGLMYALFVPNSEFTILAFVIIIGLIFTIIGDE